MTSIRAAIGELLAAINEFIDETARHHPGHEHERCNALANRTKAVQWLNQSLARFCETLGAPAPQTWLPNPIGELKDTLRESADAALMTLIEALEAGDEFSWDAAHHVSQDRSELMSRVRSRYYAQHPQFNEEQVRDVLLATNAFEEFFYSLRHLEHCWNPNPSH